MILKHNKKRNVGLVYEFFSRYIGKAIIEGRDQDVNRARELVKRHFNKGTDLAKELRLFNLLYESKVANREMAVHLINRVRESVGYQSQTRLDLEKTALVREINMQLGGDSFYNQTIPNYKTYATIQTLLNNWRGGTEQLQECLKEHIHLEEQLINHLTNVDSTTQQPSKLEEATKMTDEDVNHLVINIMTEKVNERFGDKLTPEQKKIIQLYVFEKDQPEHSTVLTEMLEGTRARVLRAIETGKVEFGKDRVLVQKLDEVKRLLTTEFANISQRDDDMIGFYLGLPNLEKELMSNDK